MVLPSFHLGSVYIQLTTTSSKAKTPHNDSGACALWTTYLNSVANKAGTITPTLWSHSLLVAEIKPLLTVKQPPTALALWHTKVGHSGHNSWVPLWKHCSQ